MMHPKSLARVGTLALVALTAASAVQAGPPMVCFPMDIGTAASLPFGTHGWKDPSPDYDRARLVPDTLALLSPRTPVLGRMETLRRATVYAASDPAQATALLDALQQRAGKTTGADMLQASFDLGYLVETYKQARHMFKGELPGGETDGRLLVAEAAKSTADPAMAYAMALILTDGGSRERPVPYLKTALKGAPAGSPLARTIAAHAPMWGSTLADLKTGDGHTPGDAR